MLAKLGVIFHRMMNPHCPHCLIERECSNCDLLRQLLETEKFEKTQLLNRILGPGIPQQIQQQNMQPIPSPYPPFRIRRAQLEADDRKEFERIIKARESAGQSVPKSTEELEKELGVEHASE